MYGSVVDLIIRTDRDMIKDKLIASMTLEEIEDFIIELEEKYSEKECLTEDLLN